MRDEYLVTIDNGGTNTKAVIFDLKGNQISEGSFATQRVEPYDGWREVDMESMWTSILDAISVAIEKAKIDPKSIIGLTTVGHGKGLYLIDGEGKPVRNGILSTDSRCNSYVEKFNDNVDEVSSISHQPVLPIQSPVLLNWLKYNERESYDKIEGVLSAKDYVRFKLTGQYNQEYSDASGNNFLNLDTRDYDKRLFEMFDIEEIYEIMPPLVNYNDIVGGTTKEVERLTGIPEGTPVAGGMFDINASALATNVTTDEYISVTAGTWAINEYLSTETNEEDSSILNSIFVEKEYYLIESSSATSAGNLDVILENLLGETIKHEYLSDDESLYSIVSRYLGETDAETTNVIYLPFLYGTNVNPLAKGAFIGLQSNTSAMEIIRAVCEGVVFSHKYHLDALLETKHTPTKGIRLAGGVVNSSEWVQVFSDVLGMSIETVSGTELGCLGGAIGLAYGLGKYSNLEEAISNMTDVIQKYEPNLEETKKYAKKYKTYVNIIEALDPLWNQL